MSTHKIVTGGFFAECPDCQGTRYARAPYVNGRGQSLEAFACDGCPGDDGVLCTVDLVLDSGEEYDTRTDETGRPALWVTTYDEYDDDDDDDGIDR
jgi:hypothetical protein